MYQDFFSLKDQPFSISPDPDFLFLSDRHKEALAHLTYGLQGNGGFVLLTGEVGTGKTTVCRALLQELPDNIDIAFILNPALTEIELLATICDEFKIQYQQENISLKLLFDALTSWMMNNLLSGRSAIVLIDEAQHLSFSVLEQLRLLTNIESNNKKPLQVILIGQTELQQKLKEQALRQLAQRITARYHLLPLTKQETEYYIAHRLNIAGARAPVFDKKSLYNIFNYSKGIPRLINLLCDRSMLCAYTKSSPTVCAKMVKKASFEIALTEAKPSLGAKLVSNSRILLLLLLTGLLIFQAPSIIAQLSFYKNKIISVPSVEINDPVVPAVSTQLLTEEAEPAITIEAENNEWLDAYPELDASDATYRRALVNLYAVWGYQADVSNVNCEQAESVLLYCYSTIGSVKKLKQLNFPAIVTLENELHEKLYAVLYKIDQQYQLLIDGQIIKVSPAWFNKYWVGDITLLWQAPFEFEGMLKLGQENEQVEWLVKQLNEIQGLPMENKNRYDLPLMLQVSEFQRSQGLKDDGIVGVQTLIPLVQRHHPELPTLKQGG